MREEEKTRPLLLLALDDDRDVSTISEALGDEVELHSMTTGGLLLERARSGPAPELFIIGVSLPDSDGFELCRALKREASIRQIPVVFVFKEATEEVQRKSFEVGAADYLVSPLDLSTVRARVRTQLELERLRRLTVTALAIDPTTSVAAQHGVEEFIEMEWLRAARETTAMSLVLLAVDSFRDFEETFGEQAVDGLMMKLADALASTLRRPMDFLGRYGSDGFAVVLPVTEYHGASYLGEKMRWLVEVQAISAGDESDDIVTVSVGTATAAPQPGSTPQTFVDAARNALETAMFQGGNTVKSTELFPNEL